MKLKRGQKKTLSELTGYTEKYIHQVFNDGVIEMTKGKTKVLKAYEIMEKGRKGSELMIKEAMFDIDWRYASSVKDIFHFSDEYLLRKFKTTDLEVIEKKLI